MDMSFMQDITPQLLRATKNTITLAVGSLIVSLFIAIIISLAIYYKVPILTQILKIYVSFFRGTPALVQLYLIYFGLGNVGIDFFRNMSAYSAVLAALSLNMSAYMAENLRGALSSVDKEQIEAGITTGLTRLQIFFRIIFPQAFRVAVPSLGNSFVDLVKGSSMAFTIGVTELMASANLSGIATYKFLESFIVAAIIYWILTIAINYMQKRLEVYMNRAY